MNWQIAGSVLFIFVQTMSSANAEVTRVVVTGDLIPSFTGAGLSPVGNIAQFEFNNYGQIAFRGTSQEGAASDN